MIGVPATSATAHQGTGEVIILTGPPGAGKTSVADLVASSFPLSVHLHSDEFWRWIRKGGVAPYLPQAHRQNEVVMDAVVEASFRYAVAGYIVICDGIVGPWFLPPFLSGSARYRVPLHYVVLRPRVATTVQRATGRAADALTDPAPIRSLHEQFSSLGRLEPHVLDSTALNEQATAATVLSGLRSGTFALPGGSEPPPARNL